MSRSPFFLPSPQDDSPQYLEDLATGYWFSLALFTAVETGLFGLLDPCGMSLDELAPSLGFALRGARRLLDALCAMGLLVRDGDKFFNSKVSGTYLVAGKEYYQGDSILWRKDLVGDWGGLLNCLKTGRRIVPDTSQEDAEKQHVRISRYIRAMDQVARAKAREMLQLFEGMSLEGEILDAGAGSGAIGAHFLDRFPGLKATFMDIPEVIDHTRGFVAQTALGERVRFCGANILEPWPFGRDAFSLIILSNIIHAYSEEELPHILSEAARSLTGKGTIVIHDFFFEHFPVKSALFDLHMFINTYNGRVFSWHPVKETLEQAGLYATDLIPFETDTGLIVASKDEEVLHTLRVDKKERLLSRVRSLGFRNVVVVPAAEVCVPDWTALRCRFGCAHFGAPSCPPHGPTPEATRSVLKDYSCALIVEGEPPTRAFQLMVLAAEREAFLSGFYKAFAYWAGPCSLCPTCASDGTCRNTKDARPSMEGAGIDVFETVRRAGLEVRTLRRTDDFVEYFGLILLE